MKPAGDGERWHEYPVGVGAEWAYAVLVVLVPFLGGLFVSFVSMIVIGVIGEEGVFTDLLARWVPFSRADEVSDNLDLLLRISILPVVGFAYLGVLLLSLAETAFAVGVSKALFAAAHDGDPRLVPPPSQMRTVEGDPLESMRIFAKGNLFVGGLAVLVLLLFTVMESSAVGLFIAVVVAAYTIGLWAGIKKLTTRQSETQRRWRERVAARWTEDAENEVRAGAAKKPASAKKGNIEGAPGGRRRGLARTFVLVPGGLGLVAAVLMQLGLVLRHPGSTKYDLGESAEYGAAGEALINGIWWLVFAVVAACLLMILATAFLAQSGTSSMERWLRERAADPGGKRPPYDVLLGFSERQGLPALRGLGLLAGLVSVFGTGLVLLGAFDMGSFAEIYSGSDQVFGGYLAPALGVVGGILLLVLICMGLQVWQTVSEREFRNLLRERWPIRPPGVGQRKSDEAKSRK